MNEITGSSSVAGRDHWLVRGRRLWLTAFAAFFLLGAGWATATPYNGAPDEINHITRAAGVVRGELVPQGDPARRDLGYQSVPAGLAHGRLCWQANSMVSAACGEGPSGERKLVKVASTAGHYPPLYYLLVGAPLALAPNWGGVIAARLLSVALAAALLAGAAYCAARWTRHRLLPAAVVVATTPMTLHLAGSINPNGAEIAAGTALFAALLPLLLGDDARHRRGVLLLATISGSVLVLLRGLSPLWLLIAVGVLLIPNRRARLAALARSRAVRVAAGVLGLALVLAVTWLVTMRTGTVGWVNLPPPLTFGEAVRIEILARTWWYAQQMVGVMSWTDTWLPGMVYFAWFMALGGMVLIALAVGTRVQRWRLVALAAAVFAVPVIAEPVGINTYGFITQGRYLLPVAVGVPLLAAWIIGEQRVLSAGHAGAVARYTGLLLAPLQVVALWYTMVRWQHGGIPNGPSPIPLTRIPLNPFTGTWLPPLGPAVPLLLATAGAALLLAYAWLARPSTAGRPAAGVLAAEVPAAAWTSADDGAGVDG